MLGYEDKKSLKINRLYLRNFRNYLDLDIEFNDKLNIIIGNNAQGKTNILEAIYFLSITKFHTGTYFYTRCRVLCWARSDLYLSIG